MYATAAVVSNIRCISICLRRLVVLSSEIVEAYHIVLHSERMEKVEDGLGHHRRTAEIVFAVFWVLMLFEVCIAHYRSYEARGIAKPCCISLRVRTVECEVEMEIRIVFLKL